jgi:hypothetical protein
MSYEPYNHHLIRGTGKGGECLMCAMRTNGDRTYAFFDLAGGEPVEPGLIVTRTDEVERRVFQHKDIVSGAVVHTSVEAVSICSDCVRDLARALEIGPDVEVVAERDRLAEENEQVRGKLAVAERSVSQLEEGARLSGVLSRVLEAEQSEPPRPARRAKAAA